MAKAIATTGYSQAATTMRCQATPPNPNPRFDDGYACDYQQGHDGPHAAHAIGYSWREGDELDRTWVWYGDGVIAAPRSACNIPIPEGY